MFRLLVESRSGQSGAIEPREVNILTRMAHVGPRAMTVLGKALKAVPWLSTNKGVDLVGRKNDLQLHSGVFFSMTGYTTLAMLLDQLRRRSPLRAIHHHVVWLGHDRRGTY